MCSAESRYGETIFASQSEVEQRRLQVMGEVSDVSTQALLNSVGVTAGWKCWEGGAGAGTIARWLAERVDSGGHVLATDIDTTALSAMTVPNLTVRQHDVVRDVLPEQRFDLIHARYVLEHIGERDQVLDRLVTALRPGGALVVESIAEFPIDSSLNAPFRKAMRGIERILAQTIGTDSHWPRTFPRPLQERGLIRVGTQVVLPSTGARNPSAECWSLTLQQLREQLLDRELCDEATLDEALRLLAEPDFYDYSFATLSCWGRAPDHPGS
jgi:2-polyprenyl-3-methyl-5-hydroxy-6-metoxy-1,4-benzoquinol methylase